MNRFGDYRAILGYIANGELRISKADAIKLVEVLKKGDFALMDKEVLLTVVRSLLTLLSQSERTCAKEISPAADFKLVVKRVEGWEAATAAAQKLYAALLCLEKAIELVKSEKNMPSKVATYSALMRHIKLEEGKRRLASASLPVVAVKPTPAKTWGEVGSVPDFVIEASVVSEVDVDEASAADTVVHEPEEEDFTLPTDKRRGGVEAAMKELFGGHPLPLTVLLAMHKKHGTRIGDELPRKEYKEACLAALPAFKKLRSRHTGKALVAKVSDDIAKAIDVSL